MIANAASGPLNPAAKMKFRNQMLALFCLLVFAAFGFLYVRTWVVQKPFGMILFVSDGLITRHLTAARLYEGGADHRLAIEAMPNMALLKNSARDFAVPDDAAAATALATGTKVNHRAVAVDSSGQPLRSIVELAREQGRAVGLVSSGKLSSPTAAAFYAHFADARDSEQMARQLVENTPLDVVLGGGSGDFLPKTHGGTREDSRDLVAELRAKNWEIVRTRAELENAAAFQASGLFGLFGEEGPSPEVATQQLPSLADLVRRAIEFLQVNRGGYLLVVDAALPSTAAERNEGERLIIETLGLDAAMATAMKYAGERSLIIGAGKHATGGMSLNGYPLRQDHGVALLGLNVSGQPTITWATGPNGPAPATPPTLPPPNADPGSTAATPPAPTNLRTEPAVFQTSSALNTAEDVIAIGKGAGSERIRGFLENTAIFQILKDAL